MSYIDEPEYNGEESFNKLLGDVARLEAENQRLREEGTKKDVLLTEIGHQFPHILLGCAAGLSGKAALKKED